MRASTILIAALVVVLFVMTIVNTRRIEQLRDSCSRRGAVSQSDNESLVMRSPAGVMVPKTPYFVTLVGRPAGDVKAADAPERVYVALGGDATKLKDDINARRVTYVFRADLRTLYSIVPMSTAQVDKSAPLTGSEKDSITFGVRPVDGGGAPFAADAEYTAPGSEVTIIGIPRYSANKA